MTLAAVKLWGREIGAVSVDGPTDVPVFQYTPEFARSGIQPAPFRMPLRSVPYAFPALTRVDAFNGLPGLLADSLPDRWGQTLVGAWLRAQGRSEDGFDVVERLCYTGTRGMGALEFEPAVTSHGPTGDADLRVDLLVELANEALSARERFVPDEEEMRAILAIGTSAGGARPKAVIAFDERTGRVRSGQAQAPEGFTHWLLKFDGVAAGGDHGLRDPQGWGAMEFAYWHMARAAGIEMTDCRLLEEHGRRHFMTRRFDRTDDGGKRHVQTIAALEHVDYDQPGVYGYEQALVLLRGLGLHAVDAEQLFRRMVFNVVARNQDDHVKNTAFLMGRDGVWCLAPAYDLTWSYKPGNRWLQAHQMTINGKRDDFTVDDLRTVARVAGLRRGRSDRVLREIVDVVAEWPTIADDVGVDEHLRDAARASHRLELPER
ncbi:MAG: type II toxin-antitoxin system HipA family toxin [Solirubrobacteraceae bacterium]